MRKMLMRICLGVFVPGGPCALEVKAAIADTSIGAIDGTTSGMAKVPDRFDSSVSLIDTAFGVVRECTAQWGQNPTG